MIKPFKVDISDKYLQNIYSKVKNYPWHEMPDASHILVHTCGVCGVCCASLLRRRHRALVALLVALLPLGRLWCFAAAPRIPACAEAWGCWGPDLEEVLGCWGDGAAFFPVAAPWAAAVPRVPKGQRSRGGQVSSPGSPRNAVYILFALERVLFCP